MAKFAMEKSMNEPRHIHNVDHVEKCYGGGGHVNEQHKVKKMYSEAPHKMQHEHVMAMCGGGKTYSAKVVG
jgi:hypothetical protein